VTVVLLDTHVWLWSVEGDASRVGQRARRALARAEGQDAIRVSPATIFEVTALHTLGRVRLARPPHAWIREALEVGGIRIAELTPAAALDAGAIPRNALADPLDRLLVATARDLDATFLTSDRRILDYAAKTRAVRVLDASQ
jgi:PIN domain nuclease of toxin-antitoxin system